MNILVSLPYFRGCDFFVRVSTNYGGAQRQSRVEREGWRVRNRLDVSFLRDAMCRRDFMLINCVDEVHLSVGESVLGGRIRRVLRKLGGIN